MRGIFFAIVIGVSCFASVRGQTAPGPGGQTARLVGLVPSSGQALVWDASARLYVLLKKGDLFRGSRILDLGVDRILAERRGVKFIWKLGAPPLLHPARAAGSRVRLPGLIVTPEAPPPLGSGPRARRRIGALPPVPRSADEPRKVVVRRAVLELSDVHRLAADFLLARREVLVQKLPGGRLRIQYLQTGSVLQRLGLAVGDVLLRVADRSIGSAADAAEIFAELRAQQVVKVELARGSKLIDLHVRLR